MRAPSPTPTKTIQLTPTPTPLLGDSNLDVNTPPVLYTTECVDPSTATPLSYHLLARRVVYVWMTDLLGRDPSPTGYRKYAGKLFLDDKNSHLGTADEVARHAYEYAGVADRYFGIWRRRESGYGMAAMELAKNLS